MINIIKKRGGIYLKKGIYRVLSKMSDQTELPLTELCSEFTANIIGRREITIDGVLSIYKYETEEIIIEVCGDYVAIIGEGLELKNYYRSTLSVGGKIKRIEYGVEICR
ncbi:MAG: hypothetical protein E7574_01270 [Ruminococcaceae bacterium]|nr:hypothetical protein [Oscillospiraceae bacterium]